MPSDLEPPGQPYGPMHRDTDDTPNPQWDTSLSAWPWPAVGQGLGLTSTLLWAAALLVYLALRLLILTDFNTSSALTVLAEEGTSTTLLGTVVGIVTILPAVAFIAAAYYYNFLRTHRRDSLHLAHIYLVTSFIAMFF